MKISALIRQARANAGLSENSVATVLQISVSSYCDLESYDDEWLDMTLGNMRKLAQVLRFDLVSAVEHSLPQDLSTTGNRDLCTAFKNSGKSIAQLSDATNVKESAISEVLADPRALDEWPISFVASLCSELGVPLQAVWNT
jgi:lambda repressor-like predicted transcriptional regulator